MTTTATASPVCFTLPTPERQPGKRLPILDTGDPTTCPNAKSPCSDHTPYRFVWSPPAAQFRGNPNGIDVAVIMQNPSCPDDVAGSQTFANVKWLVGPGQIDARRLTMLNVIPHRSSGDDFVQLTVEKLSSSALTENLDMIEAVVSAADLVIAAWGGNYRKLRSASRKLYIRQLDDIKDLLGHHPDVRQAPSVCHPAIWKQHRAELRFGGSEPSWHYLRPWSA